MKRLQFASTGIPAVVFLFTILQAGGQKTRISLKQPLADPMATHNMLVVGEKTVYLSHLPMFPETESEIMPHRYQAILEVSFEKQGSNPDSDYMKDRQHHPDIKIYTINPKPFVLPTLVSTPQGEPLHKFNASVFRGHLEKGGTRILSDLEVNVKRVIYFQQFDPLAKRPAQLEYLLFGKEGGLFLAHLIVAPPDFDQVASVSVTEHSFNDEELARGVKVSIPGTINSSGTRLKEKQQVEGVVNLDNASISTKIQLEVNRELYFEEGELRVPANFETTPEEKKGGFQ